MCGIAGFINTCPQTSTDAMQEIVKHMSDSLIHRGPDNDGTWVDAETGIALGHRRLSIIDLSPQGHQPMFSASGRYVITYNGEIYNFKNLRQELENTAPGTSLTFRGHSDTEIMLAAIETFGLESALKRFVGMFAFALWDRREQNLHLVRDRLGEKPLYYGWMGKSFLFGSELKALRAHPDFKIKINRDVLALYLRHNYILSPYSIYKGIYKLPPGTILTLKRSEITSTPAPKPYWSARFTAESGAENPFPHSEEEAIDRLDDLLSDAVKQQMIADVPLGAFLSGGIDSSTVVALMQAQSSLPVKTFSIGFTEPAYNEAENAKAVARHLGTDHTELYVTPQQAMDVIPQLPTLYDEPFSDMSQIPTFLVAKLARKNVTVCLSGDGGDELFGGYDRYVVTQRIWDKIGLLPQPGRSATSKVLKSIPVNVWNAGFNWLSPHITPLGKAGPVGDKIHKLAVILSSENPDKLYYNILSAWKHPDSLVPRANEPATILKNPSMGTKLQNFIQRMMFLDMVTYLTDDILVKMDRASMSVSLETRIPLLDHRVVEFAWQVPVTMKIRDGKGKWLLRQVLFKYVPRKLIERPKKGFGVPVGAWLRGPLREWAENLLDEKRLREDGFFHSTLVREKWNEHLTGTRNWQYHLWSILIFQAWLEQQKNQN